jgi:Tfp pilus assembly protein PilF
VDEARFQEAKQLYAVGDYRSAAKAFLAAAGRGTDGNGAAFHLAGNSLLKLRRHADAVTVYRHALNDELYDQRGAVRVNLAIAYVSQGEYARAIDQYKQAVQEPDYSARYKAFQGMAGALLETGRTEEAASAYRQAALDGANPDPGKALNNLGLCFMALKRPEDAIEAYKAALGFDTYGGRGKALANLGIAFVTIGQDAEAVKAFDKATQLHGHELAPRAQQAYERSRGRLDAARPRREVVEGWQTGELPPVADLANFSALSTPDESAQVVESAPSSVVEQTGTDLESAAEVDVFADDEEIDTSFFTRTDQEMREHDREARRAERAARKEGREPAKFVATIVLAVVVVLAVFSAAYFSGLGLPTQRMTVEGMLRARAEAKSVEGFWVAVPSADVDKEMAKLPPMKEFVIGPMERSPRTSKVTVTITPQDGAPLTYQITLAREGVGWKVTGVENDWRSTGGGS